MLSQAILVGTEPRKEMMLMMRVAVMVAVLVLVVVEKALEKIMAVPKCQTNNLKKR
jgi:hypothetical protein